MLWIVAIIHVSLLPDKNVQQKPPYSNQSAADELKKYKELLDQGVITTEEFQIKKEQLLSCFEVIYIYGSYDCPQVWTLRRYRDCALAETWY